MNDFLFDEFNPVTAKQWKQKIQVDLKGADYNETLLWKTNEGITIKPFYHQDEVEQLLILPKINNVAVCQSIYVSDEKTANFLAKDALKRGADSIQFEANEPFNIEELLKGIITQNLSTELKTDNAEESLKIHFKLNFLDESFLSDLIYKTTGSIVFLNIDIIGKLAKTGNWFYNQKKRPSNIRENS